MKTPSLEGVFLCPKFFFDLKNPNGILLRFYDKHLINIVMNYKLFKKIAAGAIGLLSILLLALCVHIYMVTHKPKTPFELTQLSRIDFKQKIDSVEANNIRAFVASQVGVKSSYFNVKDGILVYTFLSDKQNSLTIFNKLMTHGHYKAEPYIVSKSASNNGCPAGFGSQSSFSSFLLSYLK